MNKWLRQIHRWVSIAFTLGVIVNLIALAQGVQTVWIGLLSAIPLIILWLTGTYMFLRPYLSKRQAAAVAATA